MDQLHEPKSAALRAMFWRDEILQLTFWRQGEGVGDRVDSAWLERLHASLDEDEACVQAGFRPADAHGCMDNPVSGSGGA